MKRRRVGRKGSYGRGLLLRPLVVASITVDIKSSDISLKSVIEFHHHKDIFPDMKSGPSANREAEIRFVRDCKKILPAPA